MITSSDFNIFGRKARKCALIPFLFGLEICCCAYYLIGCLLCVGFIHVCVYNPGHLIGCSLDERDRFGRGDCSFCLTVVSMA